MNFASAIEAKVNDDPRPALLCFSHLRWDFVFQRPQHLMERAAKTHQVFYIEEPIHAHETPHFRMRCQASGLTVLTPIFNEHCDPIAEQRRLLDGFVSTLQSRKIVNWYYTPMAMRFASDLPCDMIIYDCMDELSAFHFAPPDLMDLERRLLAQADMVFTGGPSLYAAKANLHKDVTCFASSVDVNHCAKARQNITDPADQARLPKPRVGYFGVIDERMDLGLVARAAANMPDIQFIMLGPVVKVDPAKLPRAHNLHWLGRKEYADLPAYMANWQAAWMPFAINEATRYISPTKTPEFLAAGLPVTSTAVVDVVASWGDVVKIANADTIVSSLQASLNGRSADWKKQVDARLSDISWDRTWSGMAQKMTTNARLAVAS